MAAGQRAGRFMWALAWGIGLWLATRFFADWQERSFNANPSPLSQTLSGYREVRLQANPAGHFVSTGRINGQPVALLVDTGATAVAVPLSLADTLGLRRGAPQSVATANGLAQGYRTQLAQLQVGSIVLKDVRAVLLPGQAPPVVLLGMSALKRLEFSVRSGTLVLRQAVME